MSRSRNSGVAFFELHTSSPASQSQFRSCQVKKHHFQSTSYVRCYSSTALRTTSSNEIYPPGDLSGGPECSMQSIFPGFGVMPVSQKAG
jgi:hypothetical protein